MKYIYFGFFRSSPSVYALEADNPIPISSFGLENLRNYEYKPSSSIERPVLHNCKQEYKVFNLKTLNRWKFSLSNKDFVIIDILSIKGISYHDKALEYLQNEYGDQYKKCTYEIIRAEMLIRLISKRKAGTKNMYVGKPKRHITEAHLSSIAYQNAISQIINDPVRIMIYASEPVKMSEKMAGKLLENFHVINESKIIAQNTNCIIGNNRPKINKEFNYGKKISFKPFTKRNNGDVGK